MSADIFANAESLRFGAKTEDLQGVGSSVTLYVALQRYDEGDEYWSLVAGAGDVNGHTPSEITFGDVTIEGLAAQPESISQWQSAQAGDRIIFNTGRDADVTFATINLV